MEKFISQIHKLVNWVNKNPYITTIATLCTILGLLWLNLLYVVLSIGAIVFLAFLFWERFLRQPAPINPFGDQGKITNAALFFKRENLLREIFEELKKGTNLLLLGDTQMGKSSLLHYVKDQGAEALQLPKERLVYLDMQKLHGEPDFFKALCCEMGITETLRGFDLNRTLRGQQWIVCLDEIERLANEKLFSRDVRSELRGLANGQDEPLTLLIASRSPLDKVFSDSTGLDSPFANIFQTKEIKPFSPQEVSDFIHSRLQPTKIRFTDEEIQTIWETTQGHPAQVQQQAKELFDKKSK
jgi:predicted AAA+ superfamily ATPase